MRELVVAGVPKILEIKSHEVQEALSEPVNAVVEAAKGALERTPPELAADIIETITVDPSIESVGVLALLVAVRIALSFSLDIEVEGMVPWRRAAFGARTAPD